MLLCFTTAVPGTARHLPSKRWYFCAESLFVRRWENPLMGWTSTADQLDHVARSAMQFWTKEDCIRFAEKHGWAYEVRDPELRSLIRSKRYPGYGDNFR